MAMRTVRRRWTVATWHLARHGGRTESISAALDGLDADAIALQSITRRDLGEVAAALGMNHTWALSHSRRTRLLPGSGVGLAVLTPHRIASTRDAVVSVRRSRWSGARRIAQFATVERGDHSGCTVVHAVAAHDLDPIGGVPAIRIRPTQVVIDAARAVTLPEGAEVVSTHTSQPIPSAEPLLTVTFELPWVEGDAAAT